MNVENPFIVSKPESGSRKFWRIVFGSFVGFLLASVLMAILSFFVMIGMVAAFSSSMSTMTSNPMPVVKENSILKITLPYQIVERGIDNPFEGTAFSFNENMTGLDDILRSIKTAAEDSRVLGIYLNVPSVNAAPATIHEIRDALAQFKTSGKFIYAYAPYYSQMAYYMATVADTVVLNVKGSIDFKGIASQTLFYKGLLDKLDAEVQVVRHGNFKSAVEPFLMEKMSEANRLQTSLLVNTIWQDVRGTISLSRDIDNSRLDSIANHLSCYNANTALMLGLVDKICYEKNVNEDLKTLSGKNDLDFVLLSEYRNVPVVKAPQANRDVIAMIYANGDITDGKSSDNIIGGNSLCKTIREVYENEKVKAIVLRVNSPGGSAFAAEQIWREIENAKDAGKIVVVSMGDYAASGGYYIACNAHAIVAQPTTITGSIGVFGIIPNLQNTLKNKLGITVDVVKTHEHADNMSVFRPLDKTEQKVIQVQIEDIYDTFLQRVAAGRDMTLQQIDSIAQGRVWCGQDALAIGLIDKLGNINTAIEEAARLANLTDYKIESYPTRPDWLTRLFKPDREAATTQALKSELGELYFTYSALKYLTGMQGIQARMPMEIEIK
ncbi:MAG: signal peptide peptidase SppA [Bacteroidales bacterium]|jgi:protease-4|nr:signal peptide peptidase SppA [Bacteroidales bacterium]